MSNDSSRNYELVTAEELRRMRSRNFKHHDIYWAIREIKKMPVGQGLKIKCIGTARERYRKQSAVYAIAAREKIAVRTIVWKIGLDLVLYTAGDAEPNVVQSTELNNLLDATETSLQSLTPVLTQLLGKPVNYCRIDGKIEIVENVQGTMAMAVVPVAVEITA